MTDEFIRLALKELEKLEQQSTDYNARQYCIYLRKRLVFQLTLHRALRASSVVSLF